MLPRLDENHLGTAGAIRPSMWVEYYTYRLFTFIIIIIIYLKRY
jgi:hypothetical protein